MTANQILIGVGLILVLAVGSQVLAGRLRIPAIIVLLPAGFVAGARIVACRADGVLPGNQDVLFLVRADGQLAAVTRTGAPAPQPGDTVVSLGPVPYAQPRRLASPVSGEQQKADGR